MDDLDKFPTFDELYESNPAFRLFTDHLKGGDLVDLDAVWRAAPARSWWSPRRWHNRFRRRFDGEVEDRDGRLFAEEDAALHYIQTIDHDVQMAVFAQFKRGLRLDPARHMAGCPDPLMAIFAKGELAARGMDDDEAGRYLVAEAVERTANLDVFEQETVVAEVQRAVKGARLERSGGGA